MYGVGVALVAISVLATVVSIASLVLLRSSGALRASKVDPRRIEILRTSVFGGLLPTRLMAAARRLVPVDVTNGQAIIEQGDAADRFYFIDSGTFRVDQRAPDGVVAELRTMGPGEAFGEIGLLTSVPRTATVTAVSDGRLFALDREGFLRLVNSGPALVTQLLDRYRRTTPD